MNKVYVYDKASKEMVLRPPRLRRGETWPHRTSGWVDAGSNEQLDEMRAIDKADGIAETEYVQGEDGLMDVIWRDRNHRKRWCEAHGQFDRDAGYSDAQPKIARGERRGFASRILGLGKGG